MGVCSSLNKARSTDKYKCNLYTCTKYLSVPGTGREVTSRQSAWLKSERFEFESRLVQFLLLQYFGQWDIFTPFDISTTSLWQKFMAEIYWKNDRVYDRSSALTDSNSAVALNSGVLYDYNLLINFE